MVHVGFHVGNVHDHFEANRIADTMGRASTQPVPALLERARARWLRAIPGLALGEWARPTPECWWYVATGSFGGQPVELRLAPQTGNYTVALGGRSGRWITRYRHGDGYPWVPLARVLRGEPAPTRARRWRWEAAPCQEASPASYYAEKAAALARYGVRALYHGDLLTCRRVPGGVEVRYCQQVLGTLRPA